MATAGPRAGRRSRSESSVIAALSGLTVSVVLAILAMSRAAQHGVNAFFGAPDARYFRLVARDPFGHGHAIHSAVAGGEASYRYGRILLPLLAWVTAAGRPGAVNVTLVLWNIVAIGACVTASALLLSARGANPRLALAILVTPGLLVLSTVVDADPLALACILFGYWFMATNRPRAATAALGVAILARETAVIALVPLVARAALRGDTAALKRHCAALVPAGLWYVWVWARVGQLPFLASTYNRRAAVSPPFVGLARFVTDAHAPDRPLVAVMVVVTVALGATAWRVSRWHPIGDAAGAFAVMALCLGPNALGYAGETLRLLATAQGISIIALASTTTSRRCSWPPTAVRDRAGSIVSTPQEVVDVLHLRVRTPTRP